MHVGDKFTQNEVSHVFNALLNNAKQYFSY